MSNIYKKLSLAAALVIGATPVYADTLLIKNVNGYTLDESGELVTFKALAVDDGKISGLNPDTTVQYDRMVDGSGKTLLPGMIDAHGHLLGLGSNLLEVDLRDTDSVQQAVSKVAEYALANSAGEWITGRGWNQELWSDRAYPRASDLDSKIDDRPVWLTRVDGHAGWANSRALKIAGIDKNTQSPKGGQIVKDAQGNPTGVLIDNAMGLLEKHIPATGNKQLSAQLDAAGQHLLANGVTAMHDAGIPHSVYDFYLRRAVESTLPVRIYAMISATDSQLATMLDNGPIRDADDYLFINSVKAYGDGALGSRGAALLKPYSDAPHQKGLMVTQPEDFPGLFNQVINAGFQLNFHAIGDRANRLALDQFEATFDEHGGQSLRNRIEHAQVVAPSDLARFSSLQILPSMQPTHATSDKNMAEDRIGKARMEGAYAWQTLLKSGIAVPLGSDFPVELANPFYGIHAAVTRQDRDNNPVKGWYAHEALSIKQAFKGFTLDAAYAAHMEDSLGTLTPGKWADFIIVDQDIFSVKPEALWKTSVEQTWVAGEKVFEK
ncbi:amidohydrolase [Salinimonas iocasae]|uniref:Amidohydrolase n=1 Tax=Salinimonas iocasae TaxID=2572577 RepID=A0A5B7YAJ3_9ALTE|nr:amidohydrolase [Salinimonas iocasae]QCZ92470.1 amidohydrolase [Salinimonas iocasae]